MAHISLSEKFVPLLHLTNGQFFPVYSFQLLRSSNIDNKIGFVPETMWVKVEIEDTGPINLPPEDHFHIVRFNEDGVTKKIVQIKPECIEGIFP